MKITTKQKVEVQVNPKKNEIKETPTFVKDYKSEPCKGCGNKKIN
jgi:hypothetical protein